MLLVAALRMMIHYQIERICLLIVLSHSLISVSKLAYIMYQDCYYHQTFGTPMGSPVSFTVANLVVEEIEQKALSTFESPPRFWKRYVDDTLTVLHKDTINIFHEHLNSINPHIQFTVEVESDRTLPFLDVLIRRDVDGCISTSVYRKPTHTDKYLDFSSHHPLQHKVSVIRTLFARASNLSSSMPQRVVEKMPPSLIIVIFIILDFS